MRVKPLVAAIGIVLVLVLAGGITSGLILARDGTPPSVPEAPVSNSPNATDTLQTTPIVTPALDIEGPPAGKPTAVPPGGGEILSVEESSELEGAGKVEVYTWQDGDDQQRVVLEPQQALPDSRAGSKATGMADDGLVDTGDSAEKEEPQSSVQKQPRTDDEEPVFRSESGGELMTLPGGIILALDPEWDEAAVEKFLSDNGISMDQATEIDFLDNGFFVETEPGFPSLELANALAEQGGVVLSSPNWAREMERK